MCYWQGYGAGRRRAPTKERPIIAYKVLSVSDSGVMFSPYRAIKWTSRGLIVRGKLDEHDGSWPSIQPGIYCFERVRDAIAESYSSQVVVKVELTGDTIYHRGGWSISGGYRATHAKPVKIYAPSHLHTLLRRRYRKLPIVQKNGWR
jgi:hypothetical protein